MADFARPGRSVAPTRLLTIAHILPYPSVGGTEHATLRIAKAVDRTRFTNIAFCIPDAQPVRSVLADSGIACVTYEPPVPSYRHAAAYLRSSIRFARALRRHKVDLVHCADFLAAYQVSLGGRLAGLPILCHVRNRYSDISLRDRSFLWPVSKFVFVSRDTWRQFAHAVPDSRGTVVYDGIDIAPGTDSTQDRRSVEREFSIPEGAPIIGMMARVAPQKDFFTLARAAVRILRSEPEARFLIAGDYASKENADHYQQVHAYLETRGVARSFIFTGQRNDVPRLMNALDVFVLSTHCEGLPLVILEAMARARPVVATAVDGIPEVIRDAETGLLFPHEDDERLADHITRLLADRAWATRIGEAGRRMVAASFSGAKFAESMNAVYESLLGLPPQHRVRSSGVPIGVNSFGGEIGDDSRERRA